MVHVPTKQRLTARKKELQELQREIAELEAPGMRGASARSPSMPDPPISTSPRPK